MGRIGESNEMTESEIFTFIVREVEPVEGEPKAYRIEVEDFGPGSPEPGGWNFEVLKTEPVEGKPGYLKVTARRIEPDG